MHNLNVTNEKVAFASTQPAWHNLGTIVDKPMTAEEAIQLGGIGYEIEKVPLYTKEGTLVSTHSATRRVDTEKILGVVGSRYHVVQNKDAFAFFDGLLGDGHAKIETVGALGDGERIFVTAKMPYEITVGKDDLTNMYVLLTSSHDGSGAIVAGITPIRVVCQNTLNLAMSREITNKVSIRHTCTAERRLFQAGKVLEQAMKYQTSMEEAYNFLYRTKVSDSAAKSLIAQIVQGQKSDSTKMTNILEKIETCYHVGAGQKEIAGTAWGVFNGITNYLSHEKKYQNDESKFNSLLLGGESEKLIKQSFDTLMTFAKKA